MIIWILLCLTPHLSPTTHPIELRHKIILVSLREGRFAQ